MTNLPNYRAYVIFRMPSLRTLDFQKVTKKEKEAAKKLFEGASGKQLLKEMLQREDLIDLDAKKEKKTKVAVKPEDEAIVRKIAELELLIEQAESLDEVKRLEQ